MSQFFPFGMPKNPLPSPSQSFQNEETCKKYSKDRKAYSSISRQVFSARENARNRIVSNASKKPTSRRG